MEKTPEYINARSRAIKYILHKMRTSSEVYDKLHGLKFGEEIVIQVINDLTELGYINDEEYAKKFIEMNKKAKKVSKKVIKMKLICKGIDKEVVDKYLLQIEYNDLGAVKEILMKKHFSKDLPFEEQNKIKAYCLNKGFGLSDLIHVIEEEF